FATIAHGLAVARPGDIVYVRAGTYVEALNITRSGLPGKPIILSAAPGALGKVTITPPAQYVASNPGGSVITLRGADYVWITGFNIQGPLGRPEAPAAEHSGANGITWQNGAGQGDRATNNVLYNNVHSGLVQTANADAGLFLEANLVFDNGTSTLDP